MIIMTEDNKVKHKRITALLLGMVLALSGCTDARDAYGEETVASTASTESSSSQEASKETSEPSTEVQNSTETASSEPDGMVAHEPPGIQDSSFHL